MIDITSSLSARAKCSAITQAGSIVRGALKQKSKLIFVKRKLLAENKPTKEIDKKLSSLKTPSKPVLKAGFKAELSSKCVDYKEINSAMFTGFIRLKCLGETFPHIKIPIKFHKANKKFQQEGKLLGGFLISKDSIDFRWELPDIPAKTSGEVFGIDTGFSTIVTLSNGATTETSMKEISEKLARKKKGSKAFTRAQEERKNLINREINKLKPEFEKAKIIRLEEVKDLRKGKKTSRLLSGWTYTIIERKILSLAEEFGVQILWQNSAFRSQRCSCCGYVASNNRQGKKFSCKACGFKSDSDLNAAKNHEIDLPEIPVAIRINKSRSPFYWKANGIEMLSQEFRVPDTKKVA